MRQNTEHMPPGLSSVYQVEWLNLQEELRAEREYRRQILNEGNWDDGGVDYSELELARRDGDSQ